MILFLAAYLANFAFASERSDFQDRLSELSTQTQTQPLNCQMTDATGTRTDRTSLTLDFNVSFKDAFVINFNMLDSRSGLSTLIAYEGAVPGFPMGKLIVSMDGDTQTFKHVSNGVVKDITTLRISPKEWNLEYRKLDFQSAPIIDLRCTQ